MDLYAYGKTGNEISKYWSNKDIKCDECGKYRVGRYTTYTHYFKTLDGGDYMSQNECWVCNLFGQVRAVKYWLKHKIKVIKSTQEIWAVMNKQPWYSHQRLTMAIKYGKIMSK